MNARKLHDTLEPLESRIAPAALLTILDLDADGAADDIRIVGNGGKNIVTIEDNGANMLTISIDADGDGSTAGKKDLAPTSFVFNGDSATLDIKLGAGNDTINYSTTGNMSASTRMVNADLGGGKNTFAFSTGAFDVLNSSQIGFNIIGRGSADSVTVDFDEVRKSAITANVSLGKGNDTAAMSFDRIDDGSAVDLGVDLAGGVNSLTLDFQEVGFGDRGTVNVNVTGGASKDTVKLNLHDDIGDGVKASAMNFKADLGAGNDVFEANLDYTGQVFRVDDHSVALITVKGGAGNDSLSVKGVGAAGTIRLDGDSQLGIDLQGGAGKDTITADLGKTDAFEMLGSLRLRLAGGLGNDVLTAMLANDADTTGSYDVAISGDQGDDTATFQVSNNGGTPTFGPTGKILLDGGLGKDFLTNNSKPVSKATGFEQVI